MLSSIEIGFLGWAIQGKVQSFMAFLEVSLFWTLEKVSNISFPSFW